MAWWYRSIAAPGTAHTLADVEVQHRSATDRPTRSIAQAITTSNLRFDAALNIGIQAPPLLPPLAGALPPFRGRRDARVRSILSTLGGSQRAAAVAKTYPAFHPVAGAGFRGAPPIETGPTGLFGTRDVCLRDVLTSLARAVGCGIEEVVSGVTAFCSESTRAMSEES